MFTVRTRQRGFVWLALWAMLAMALLPTVSHALAASQGGADRWTEVCTPQGTQWVSLDGQPAGDAVPQSVAGHMVDCPYCLPSSVVAGLPPVWPSPWLLSASGTEPPPLFRHALRTLFAWAAAQARAPPALS